MLNSFCWISGRSFWQTNVFCLNDSNIWLIGVSVIPAPCCSEMSFIDFEEFCTLSCLQLYFLACNTNITQFIECITIAAALTKFVYARTVAVCNAFHLANTITDSTGFRNVKMEKISSFNQYNTCLLLFVSLCVGKLPHETTCLLLYNDIIALLINILANFCYRNTHKMD